LDADINFANIDSDGESLGAVVGDEVSGKMSWNGATRLRLGYAMDRFLPYIAGGLAFGELEADYDFGGISDSFSDTMFGWTIGAGFEYAITDTFTTRFEYRYTDYGSFDGDFFPAAADVSSDLTSHDIRMGVAWKF
jgi:outer membrane immunogenic protein